MGKLEDFAKENRPQFDDQAVDDRLWQAISDELPGHQKAKRLWLRPLLRVAAVALLFLSIGVVLGNYMGNSGSQQAKTLSGISPEYAELEEFYTVQINQKLGELDQYEQKEQVLKDIEELDLNFKELQQELEQTTDDEQIIHLMIENYRTKINILERVIDRLNSNDIQKKINHEETIL